MTKLCGTPFYIIIRLNRERLRQLAKPEVQPVHIGVHTHLDEFVCPSSPFSRKEIYVLI